MYQPSPPPRRPRRPVWALPAVLGGVLLVGVLAAAAVLAGPLSRSDSSTSIVDPVALDSEVSDGFDALFLSDTDTDGASADTDAGAADRPLRDRRPLRLRDGEKVVAGAVGSVGDGNLVVRRDGGAEVSVPTDGDTRVRGVRNRALSDLEAGERVIVRVGPDGTADGVLVVRAHAAGTVTALDGDRATVTRAGGLTVTLDLSGVPERPAVGTVVVAVGSATDNGATLKVDRLKELPTLG